MAFLLLFIIIISFILYRRYFPVFSVRNIHFKGLDLDKSKVIDVRDFNESYKNPIKGSINIPIAYLKRNMNEIPHCDLYVAGSSILEKNVGIRFLRKKGFRVVGYTIIDNRDKFLLKKNSLKIKTNG